MSLDFGELSGLFQKALNIISEVKEKILVRECYALYHNNMFKMERTCSGYCINLCYSCCQDGNEHIWHRPKYFDVMDIGYKFVATMDNQRKTEKYLLTVSNCIFSMINCINQSELSINTDGGYVMQFTKWIPLIRTDYWYYVIHVGGLTLFKFLGKYGNEDEIMNDYIIMETCSNLHIKNIFISTDLFYVSGYKPNVMITHTVEFNITG